MFHNNKIKYSTSTIEAGRDRQVAKEATIMRRQEKVGGKSEREDRKREHEEVKDDNTEK